MAMTIEQARALTPGDTLSFGTPHTYAVVSAVPDGHGVKLTLKRDDGVETHANANDLDVAVLLAKVVTQPIEPPAPEPEPTPVPPTEPAVSEVEPVEAKPTKSKGAKGG